MVGQESTGYTNLISNNDGGIGRVIPGNFCSSIHKQSMLLKVKLEIFETILL